VLLGLLKGRKFQEILLQELPVKTFEVLHNLLLSFFIAIDSKRFWSFIGMPYPHQRHSVRDWWAADKLYSIGRSRDGYSSVMLLSRLPIAIQWIERSKHNANLFRPRSSIPARWDWQSHAYRWGRLRYCRNHVRPQCKHHPLDLLSSGIIHSFRPLHHHHHHRALPGVPHKSQLVVNVVFGIESLSSSQLPAKFKDAHVLLQLSIN